jgi:nitroimidazol reductase NimA-like FMN-containing flavoprotein (pyridoxamine 5'-phosphate oxidase superfamily)
VSDHGSELSATPRTRHRRLREQGRSQRAELMAILQAGFIAHVGVPTSEGVMVVPTVYGFDERHAYVHGSVASQSLAADTEITMTVTIVDGLVLARSVFEHGVNYRSAMIYGKPRIVDDPAEKLAGLRIVAEHLAPGQWDYVRQPSRKELAATRLLALSLAEASVKIRTGPPDDSDSPDVHLGLWAGELPLHTRWGNPVVDTAIPAGLQPPAHILNRAGNEAHPRWSR